MQKFLLGAQTFDGLGRQLKVEAGGRSTRFNYTPGQLPPTATLLADGKQVDFTYEPTLEYQLLSIHPANEPAHTFTYDKKLAVTASASGPLGTQRMRYTPSGKPLSDTWTVDGQDHITTWRFSLDGLLLGFIDANGADQQRHFDQFGRLSEVVVENITASIAYDDFSRPTMLSTRDRISGNQLVQVVGYDSLGRECSRSFAATVGSATHISLQTLSYNDLDQLTERRWQDASREGTETFAYDLRGRLITYTAEPAVAPEDPYGNRIVEQQFILNALDGYQQVTTTFADNSQDIAHYRYDNLKDPTQVSAISHSHSSWPALIELTYDACGRVIADSLGRRMSWDAQDRLTRVDYEGKSCAYGYDPSGSLCDRILDGRLSRSFFSDGQLTHEHTDEHVLQHISDGASVVALNKITGSLRQATLLGHDAQGSVRIEADNQVRYRQYSAHGSEHKNAANSDYGFAGERREPLSGWYIPAGYRPYDPLLMIFLSPDSESPFGRGGLNAYAYCAGDPVNRVDPDGHAWLNWVIAGIGLALGAVATVASFGALAPVFATVAAGGIGAMTMSGAFAVGSAVLGAVSFGTGVAATALEAIDKDSKAASILGWISLGTGLASGVLGGVSKSVNKLVSQSSRQPGRAFNTAGQFKSGRAAGETPISSTTVTRVGNSELLHTLPGEDYSVVFHRRVFSTSVMGFETHSTPKGLLMNSKGVYVTAQDFALQEIAPRTSRSLAYFWRPKKPILLLACEAGKNGAAQSVANTLKRRVIAYGDNIFMRNPTQTNQPEKIGQAYANSNTVFKRVPPIPGGPFSDYSDIAPAEPILFRPKKVPRT
ncbi:RHS repeat domain-containing protein [Pseudomonas sp. NUPR-001]|uniref:RHS repeat domain-containing protein n=1 Tax=Pseudomonas sp. NUPR-001 TaxID=3416058 RepID=UPI003F9AA688